jgi:hypothetical protein
MASLCPTANKKSCICTTYEAIPDFSFIYAPGAATTSSASQDKVQRTSDFDYEKDLRKQAAKHLMKSVYQTGFKTT